MARAQSARAFPPTTAQERTAVVDGARKQTAEVGASERVPAFDFTKGALVLLMLVYHWANYFIGPNDYIYRFLRFVTPSFIFITGFFLARSLTTREPSSGPSLAGRFIRRGVKLWILFVVLNAIALLLTHRFTAPGDGWRSTSALVTVFASGNVFADGSGKAASFYILVPIGHLLVLSGLLAPIYPLAKGVFGVAAGVSLTGVLTLWLFRLESGALEMLAVGLLGVMAGRVSTKALLGVSRRVPVIAGAYVCYTAAVALAGAIYALQIVGVCINLLAMVLCGTRICNGSRAPGVMVLLGRYTLLGYIGQIGILYALDAVLPRESRNHSSSIMAFFSATGLTVGLVASVDWGRRRLVKLDRIYRFIFL